MRTVMLITNCILFIFGFLFHVSTYFYFDTTQFKPILNLFILGVFLLAFGLILYLFVKYKSKRIEFSPFDALISLPTILKVSINIFLIATIMIFLYNSSLLSGGGTQIVDGKYALVDKSNVLKFITEDAYYRFKFVELRMNTIMLLFFNYITMIGYYYVLKPKEL